MSQDTPTPWIDRAAASIAMMIKEWQSGHGFIPGGSDIPADLIARRISRFVPDGFRDPAPALPASRPTDAQITSACMSYRHDYGLLDATAQQTMKWQAYEWLRAWQKELGAAPPPTNSLNSRATAATKPDLAQRCREVLDWDKSGLLVDGALRKMAETIAGEAIPEDQRLHMAEQKTTREAMRAVVDGSRSAASTVEPATAWQALDDSQSLLAMVNHIGPATQLWADEDVFQLLVDQITANRKVLDAAPTTSPEPEQTRRDAYVAFRKADAERKLTPNENAAITQATIASSKPAYEISPEPDAVRNLLAAARAEIEDFSRIAGQEFNRSTKKYDWNDELWAAKFPSSFDVAKRIDAALARNHGQGGGPRS